MHSMQALAEEIMQVAHDGGTTDLALSQMAAAFHKHTQAPSAPSAPAESVPIDTPCAMCHVWATSVADRSHSLVASMEAQHQQEGEKPHPHREKEMSTARATAQGATDLVTRLQHGPPLGHARERPTVRCALQNLLNLSSAEEARRACDECANLLPVRAAFKFVEEIVRVHGPAKTDK